MNDTSWTVIVSVAHTLLNASVAVVVQVPGLGVRLDDDVRGLVTSASRVLDAGRRRAVVVSEQREQPRLVEGDPVLHLRTHQQRDQRERVYVVEPRTRTRSPNASNATSA